MQDTYLCWTLTNDFLWSATSCQRTWSVADHASRMSRTPAGQWLAMRHGCPRPMWAVAGNASRMSQTHAGQCWSRVTDVHDPCWSVAGYASWMSKTHAGLWLATRHGCPRSMLVCGWIRVMDVQDLCGQWHVTRHGCPRPLLVCGWQHVIDVQDLYWSVYWLDSSPMSSFRLSRLQCSS